MEENNQVIKLRYKEARLGRVFSTHLFDFIISILLAMIILIPSLFILYVTPVYKNIQESRYNIQTSSHLYISSESSAVLLSSSLSENNELTYNEKSEQLDSTLSYFFNEFLVEKGVLSKEDKTYTNKLLTYTLNNQNMFDEDSTRLLTLSTFDENYYNTYVDILDNYAVGYLGYVDNYASLRTNLIWCYAFTIYIALTIANFIIYLLFPLIFHRGRRTLGMLLNHVNYVSFDGFSPSIKRFLINFLIKWVLVLSGSIFSFAIPIFISVGMIFLSKHHQSITDYICGCFLVENEDLLIYENLDEYLKSQELINETQLFDVNKKQ